MLGRLELTSAKGYRTEADTTLGGPQISVSHPRAHPLTPAPTAPFLPYCNMFLPYCPSCSKCRSHPGTPPPDPQAAPALTRFVCSLKLKSREERALTPVKDPQLQGARRLQPALAALLAPLCRALPVPLGQHQQWAGPNKSRLSRHRRQADPLRCTVGMRWPQGLPGG